MSASVHATTSAHAIANAFVALAREEGRLLTNMQLQKLVFLANGYTLAFYNRPLYYNETYAWQFGPVIKALYESLRKYGRGEVTLPEDSKEMEIVKAVWEGYGEFSGSQLSALTHKPDTPWRITWRLDQFGVIPQPRTADYYQKVIDGCLV